MTNVNKKQFIIERYGLILGFILTGLIAISMAVIGAVFGFVPCMIFLASVFFVIFWWVCYEGAREYEDEFGEKVVE